MPTWAGSSPTCFFLTAVNSLSLLSCTSVYLFQLLQCTATSQIAFTAGWTAISSLIGYYKSLYGPHMLLHLNLAYFLPSLPTLLLQSVWDAKFDSKFGIAKAATVRLCLGKRVLSCSFFLSCSRNVLCLPLASGCHAGLGGSTLICIVYPFCESSRNVLLVLVSLLGLCNSVAFSTSYQIVTHFSTNNSVSLTTGEDRLWLAQCIKYQASPLGVCCNNANRTANCSMSSMHGTFVWVPFRFCGKWATCCSSRGSTPYGCRAFLQTANAAFSTGGRSHLSR